MMVEQKKAPRKPGFRNTWNTGERALFNSVLKTIWKEKEDW
jgi:hypothetical protein